MAISVAVLAAVAMVAVESCVDPPVAAPPAPTTPPTRALVKASATSTPIPDVAGELPGDAEHAPPEVATGEPPAPLPPPDPEVPVATVAGGPPDDPPGSGL